MKRNFYFIVKAIMQIAHQTYSLQQFALTQGTDKNPYKKEDEKSQSAFRPDKVTLSKEGQALASEENLENSPSEDISTEEQLEIAKLLQRDAEVRSHEQSHISASGGLSKGAPSFTMTTGPDGKSYATAGEVNIDMSSGRTPEETVEKMRTVQKAALAPATPSSADRQVATAAATKEREAQAEINAERAEILGSTTEASSDDSSSSETPAKTSAETKENSSSSVDNSYARLAIETYKQFIPAQQ